MAKKTKWNLFQLFPGKAKKPEITKEQKAAILEEALAKFFADHDKITNEVNLFPLTRAHDEVQKMIREGSLEYHFEWYKLQQEYLKNLEALQVRFANKKAAQ